MHIFVHKQTRKGERLTDIHPPCWEKSTYPQDFRVFLSKTSPFHFFDRRVSFLVGLAMIQAVLINMHPTTPFIYDRLFPADGHCASTQRRSRGTKHLQLGGGPNSNPTPPAQKLHCLLIEG